MKNVPNEIFSLDVFEGPLAFLLHLIQKSEIDICDVTLHELTTQYLNKIKEILSPSVDTGAEFIATTSFLLWMKSKTLLPKHEQPLIEEEELDPSFEIIYKLLDYCRFKEAGKTLSQIEHEQTAFHNRGIHTLTEPEKMLGIEHLSIEDLAAAFQKILAESSVQKKKIHEEPWRVADKIQLLREVMTMEKKVIFGRFFSREMPKIEIIVTFLAVLELMKIGEILVGREIESSTLYIFSGAS